MIRCWHVIALGLVALCWCASSPALSQGRNPERRAGQERPGAYILQTEEEARQQLQTDGQRGLRQQAGELADRVSRVEGRLDGIEEGMAEVPQVSTFNWGTAAAAWVGALVIALVGGLLTFIATIRAARQQAIDTEKLRVRATLVRDALEDFARCALELEKVTDERELRAIDRERFHHLRLATGNALVRLAAPRDAPKVLRFAAYADSAMKQFGGLIQAEQNGQMQDARAAQTLLVEIGSYLQGLRQIAAWAAERRIDGLEEKPDPGLIDHFLAVAEEKAGAKEKNG